MQHRRRCITAVLLGLIFVAGSPLVHGQPVDESRIAKLRVLMPLPDAQLTIEGTAMKRTGSSRLFASTPLQSGKKYTYTLVATWQPNNYTTMTRTRSVIVGPEPRSRSISVRPTRNSPTRSSSALYPHPKPSSKACSSLLA